MPVIFCQPQCVNSLCSSDAISCAIVVEVIACCLTAPSHNLNQYWTTLVRTYDIHLRAFSDLNISISKTRLGNCILKITYRSPRGQCVTLVVTTHYKLLLCNMKHASREAQNVTGITRIFSEAPTTLGATCCKREKDDRVNIVLHVHCVNNMELVTK